MTTTIVSIDIKCLSHIDTQNQRFTMTFDLTHSTDGPCFQLTQSHCTQATEPHFDNIVSLRRIGESTSTCNKLSAGDKGEIVYRTSITQRYVGIFFEHFELEHFPFDTQPLQIKLGHPDETQLRPDPNSNALTVPQLPEWKVQPTIHYQMNNGDITYSIMAHRQASSYLWKDGLPLFILQSLVWVSYFVPPEDLTDRMEITLSLLGATIAFNYVLSGHVPRTGYLNVFDKYVLGAFILIACMAYEHVATAYLADQLTDKIIMRVIGVIWVVAHMYIAYWIKTQTK